MEISVTDLHWAVRSNDVGMIKKLLAGGNPIQSCDSIGRTPLHWATVLGHEEALKALLLNTSRQLIDVSDKLGRTPLHYACAGGRTDFASLLMKRGAGVNFKDSKGRTPMHYAAQNVKADMVELLIKSGADKDAEDCNGVKPWDVALKWGCPDEFEVLKTDSAHLAGFAEPANECPQIEKIEKANDLKQKLCTEKSSSLDVLLGEWKKAEARKKKKHAMDGLKEALKAWREAETQAKLERQTRLFQQSLQDLNNQVSSSLSFTNLEIVNNFISDRGSSILCFHSYPNGNPGSPAYSSQFQYASEGKGKEKLDDAWGCTEWESPLRIDEMKVCTKKVEKWERVMDWRSLSRVTSETSKLHWFQRRNRTPVSLIEAI